MYFVVILSCNSMDLLLVTLSRQMDQYHQRLLQLPEETDWTQRTASDNCVWQVTAAKASDEQLKYVFQLMDVEVPQSSSAAQRRETVLHCWDCAATGLYCIISSSSAVATTAQ